MKNKRDISQGVVYDHDEMQWACHQLRAIQAGIDGLGRKWVGSAMAPHPAKA